MSNLNDNQFTSCSEGVLGCTYPHTPDPVLEVGKSYKIVHFSRSEGRLKSFIGVYQGPSTSNYRDSTGTGSQPGFKPIDGYNGIYVHRFVGKDGYSPGSVHRGHIVEATERTTGKRSKEDVQKDREALLSKIGDEWIDVPAGHSSTDVSALEKAGHIETRLDKRSKESSTYWGRTGSDVPYRVKQVRRVQK